MGNCQTVSSFRIFLKPSELNFLHYFSDILKIFVELEYEPLSLEQTRAIVKHREQDKTFWKDLAKEIASKAEQTTD